MFSVTPGPYAVTDRDGIALCHGARQTKSSLNSSRRAGVKALWREALVIAGLSDGTNVKVADGPSPVAPFGMGEDTRDGFADFAHITANAVDGAYCGCNAVPVEGATNRANGEARQGAPLWSAADHEAYRAAFRTLAIARMTKTKQARVV